MVYHGYMRIPDWEPILQVQGFDSRFRESFLAINNSAVPHEAITGCWATGHHQLLVLIIAMLQGLRSFSSLYMNNGDHAGMMKGGGPSSMRFQVEGVLGCLESPVGAHSWVSPGWGFGAGFAQRCSFHLAHLACKFAPALQINYPNVFQVRNRNYGFGSVHSTCAELRRGSC